MLLRSLEMRLGVQWARQTDDRHLGVVLQVGRQDLKDETYEQTMREGRTGFLLLFLRLSGSGSGCFFLLLGLFVTYPLVSLTHTPPTTSPWFKRCPVGFVPISRPPSRSSKFRFL